MAGPSGFYLGGFAQGAQSADTLALKEREVATKEQDSDSKVLGLLQARDSLLSSEVDKAIKGTTDTITSIISEARKVGAPQEKIRALVAPMMQDIAVLSQKAGRPDPAPLFRGFDAMLGIPAAPDAAATPTTEIGKVRYDLQRGFITQAEADARISRLTREVGDPNIVENIRRKIAAGEKLSVGEQKVYDDALMRDPIARLIAGSLNAQKPPAAPAVPTPPTRPDPFGMR
jgi:hypothetical protein